MIQKKTTNISYHVQKDLTVMFCTMTKIQKNYKYFVSCTERFNGDLLHDDYYVPSFNITLLHYSYVQFLTSCVMKPVLLTSISNTVFNLLPSFSAIMYNGTHFSHNIALIDYYVLFLFYSRF